MAGIQRFVTYIYAYENGQKADNTGYAKVETRGERGQMEVHVLDSGIYRGMGMVSFLYEENGKLISIPAGKMAIENGRGNSFITFRTNAVADTSVNFSKIDGISVSDSESVRCLSFWRDVKVTDFSEKNFEEYGRNLMETTESMTVKPNCQRDSSAEVLVQDDVAEISIEDAEQESLHTMEIPMRNIFPTYTLEGVWQNMCKIKVPVQVNNNTVAIQMELSELRELPKQYWYLGNNSFLLHGFFNYHHILFGRMADSIWFIGIPGVYERQERVMASIFGFSGFTYIGEKETVTSKERQHGIWYHILEQ